MHRAHASPASRHSLNVITVRPDANLVPPAALPGRDDLRVRLELLDIAARSGAFAGWLTIGVIALSIR